MAPRGNVSNKLVMINKMKKIFAFLLISNLSFAQVAIGKTTVSPSAILEFDNTAGSTKGILLPSVIDANNMTNVTPGTLVFDRATSKVKYNDGFWKELTDFQGITPLQTAGVDLPNARVIIGNQNTTTDGVLVLEAPDKALILPHIIAPELNVKSPVPGMICYDPVKNLLCIYNGKEWFFWK